MNITASALNRRINRFEDEFGAELFERLPGGVRLNPAGELVLHHYRAHAVGPVARAEPGRGPDRASGAATSPSPARRRCCPISCRSRSPVPCRASGRDLLRQRARPRPGRTGTGQLFERPGAGLRAGLSRRFRGDPRHPAGRQRGHALRSSARQQEPSCGCATASTRRMSPLREISASAICSISRRGAAPAASHRLSRPKASN